jgi:alkylhydroperoxidase family enzyme
VKCEYCGNQRSERGREAGLQEGKYDELLNFESSERFDEREKAALAYTEAIVWTGSADDELWERLYAHFGEAELVELGCFVGLTLGQQSWLRLLNIEHHQVMPGTSASMAPGFETADALAESKSAERYWARA